MKKDNPTKGEVRICSKNERFEINDSIFVEASLEYPNCFLTLSNKKRRILGYVKF